MNRRAFFGAIAGAVGAGVSARLLPSAAVRETAFLKSRIFSPEEIARVFALPPQYVGYLSASQALDRLAATAKWTWHVDADKRLHFTRTA